LRNTLEYLGIEREDWFWQIERREKGSSVSQRKVRLGTRNLRKKKKKVPDN